MGSCVRFALFFLGLTTLACGGNVAENGSTPPVGSCGATTRPAAVPPIPATTTASETWGSATGVPPDLTIDTWTCEEKRYFAWLPLGSAWVNVQRVGAGCAVWLGGETENPMYTGGASQYCEFPSSCPATLVVHASQGGPAHVDNAGCTP
jgi:hypothetical protein